MRRSTWFQKCSIGSLTVKKADQGSVSMLVSIRLRTQRSAMRGRVFFSRMWVTQHIRDNLGVEYGIVEAIGSNVTFDKHEFRSPAIQYCILDHNQTAACSIHLPKTRSRRSFASAPVNAIKPACAKDFALRLVGKHLS